MRFLYYSLLMDEYLIYFILNANPLGENLVLNVIHIMSHSVYRCALSILLVNSFKIFLCIVFFFFRYVSCKSCAILS